MTMIEDDYVYCLNTRTVHDGATTIEGLLESIDDFKSLVEALAVDHELKDSVDGGWIPVQRRDGDKIDLVSVIS